MKILIADEMHLSIKSMLMQEGWDFDYLPKVTREELLTIIKDYDGLIIRSKTYIDRAFLENAARLKFIARAGAGLDLIDLSEVENRQIQVFHAGEGNRDAVGEHVVGMLLALCNNIVRADREVRQSVWLREENRGVELGSQVVGLIGYGNNGSATAKRLKGFGCSVLAYDKYRRDYSDENAQEASLEDIFQQATVISLHIPLTDISKGMINDVFIEQMKNPFYFVNASRGEVAELGAIVKGLQSGKILGACLDVLENEKLTQLTPIQQANFDYLRASDQVVFTPHIAGWTHESYVRINEVLVKQIKANYQP